MKLGRTSPVFKRGMSRICLTQRKNGRTLSIRMKLRNQSMTATSYYYYYYRTSGVACLP
jgi:hypothetical protein